MKSLEILSEKLSEKHPIKSEKTTISKDEITKIFDDVVLPSFEKIRDELKKHKISAKVKRFVYVIRIIINEPNFRSEFCVKRGVFDDTLEMSFDMKLQPYADVVSYMATYSFKPLEIKDYAGINQENIIEWFTQRFIEKEEEFFRFDEQERQFCKNMSDFQKEQSFSTEEEYKNDLKEIRRIERILKSREND